MYNMIYGGGLSKKLAWTLKYTYLIMCLLEHFEKLKIINTIGSKINLDIEIDDCGMN